MPEGHLLHRLARDQAELAGHVVRVSSPQGRFATGAAALDGRRLIAVEAYGKNLFHRFEGDDGLRTHLGMQGKWIRLPGDRPPRPQGRVRLATPAVAWDLVAAEGRMLYKQAACRACGTPVETWDLAGRAAYACPRCQPR